MNFVQFFQGTWEQFQKLSTKDANTLYFITDKQQIYKGEVLYSENQVVFAAEAPEFANAESNVLYVVTGVDGTTIYTKGESAMNQIGGSVQAGAITSIDAFDPDMILTDAEVRDMLSSATELPKNNIMTSGGVKEIVDDAVAGVAEQLNSKVATVSAERAVDNSGTVLVFYADVVDGQPANELKRVTISDLFLTSADYDSATHKLNLSVQGVETPVEVDLNDLVGSALGDVKVAETETFTVELGTNGTLGGFKTGDKIAKDTSLETIVKKLLMKQVPPTYTQPSIAVANNTGTASGAHEIGTRVTPKLKATFTKADAGTLTNIQFKKGATNVGDAQTASPATYTEAEFTLSATTSFTAVATYAEGPIKNDNLGQPYPNGHILAGSKESTKFTFTPYRQGYFIGTTADTAAVNSATIRSLAMKKNAAYAAGTVELTVPAGAQQVIIACPASNRGMTKVINKSALNADVTSTFLKSAIDVEGANGFDAVSYNLWAFVPDVPYGQEAILAITLG